LAGLFRGLHSRRQFFANAAMAGLRRVKNKPAGLVPTGFLQQEADQNSAGR
jgi:hypothetical protein